MSLSKAVNERARAIESGSENMVKLWRGQPISRYISSKVLVIGSAVTLGLLIRRFGVRRVYSNFAIIRRLVM